MASNRYSYSKVDCYKQCPFKFKLQYLDGHYISTPGIALDVGTMIHAAEEDIANCLKEGKPINYTELKNRIILEMFKIEHKFPKDFWELDKSERLYKEKIYDYLDHGIYHLEAFMKSHPTYEVVGAEVSFKVDIHGKTFTGKIDRVLRDTLTGNYICHDVKTYPVPVEDKDLATPLQFVVYTEAMKELYHIPSEQISCGYDLPFCNIIQDAGTKGYMTRGIKKLGELLDAIDAGEFEPKPSPLCHWCQFCATNPNQPKEGKNLCPYHSLWTKETKDFQVAMEWQGLANHGIVLENYINKQHKTTV